jgi:hypothetical protein
MTNSYHSSLCRDEGRRAAVLSGSLNGIDTVEVEKNNQTTLQVFFLKGVPSGLNHHPELATVTGGERIAHIHILDTVQKADHLDVIVDQAGDFSLYTLTLTSAELDPIFASAQFSFKAECPSPFDCSRETPCVDLPETEPLIDYNVKDYASFRGALLDWISARYPNWTERNEADLGIALLELFSYAADQLSDYQDRVANEAYLETARQRVSVKRHSGLIDYRMHEGANARAMVHVNVTIDGVLAERTQVTTLAEQGKDPIGFETDKAVSLFSDHNHFDIYTWSNADCCLPAGATDAYLDGAHPNLKAGHYLLFQELKSATTRLEADADRTHRQLVQLTLVESARDPLTNHDLTKVTWQAEDALTQTFCLTTQCEDGSTLVGITIARGNIVPASHGQTTTQAVSVPALEPVDGTLCKPQKLPPRKPFRFALEESPLTFASDTDDPRDGRSTVTITSPSTGNWTERRTLLESGSFSQDFVVDVDGQGRAIVRFGDGVYGRAMPPGVSIEVTYRIGNGVAGNVGADTLIVLPEKKPGTLDFVASVTNPLPASKGTDPEPLYDVKRFAPEAFRALTMRAVTADDYARAAERIIGVQHAVAQFRWTGSWYTVFVSIDPLGRVELTDELEQKVRTQLDAFRMAGYDLEIRPPIYVPLDIAVNVCVKPDHFRADVQQELLRVLSARLLSDGARGFFHPDNFTFGDPLYISRLYQAIEKVEGVQSAEVTRFRRWGELSAGEILGGVLKTSPFEIIRLDNDASEQEHGRLTLTMLGGK